MRILNKIPSLALLHEFLALLFLGTVLHFPEASSKIKGTGGVDTLRSAECFSTLDHAVQGWEMTVQN